MFLQLKYSFNEEIHLLHGPPFFLIKKNEKKTKKKEKSFLFFLPRKTQKIVFFIPFSHDYLVLRSIT